MRVDFYDVGERLVPDSLGEGNLSGVEVVDLGGRTKG